MFPTRMLLLQDEFSSFTTWQHTEHTHKIQKIYKPLNIWYQKILAVFFKQTFSSRKSMQ
jgi:peptide methionine sulfoxide reductase MsrA